MRRILRLQAYTFFASVVLLTSSPRTQAEIIIDPPITAPVSSLTISDVDFLNSTSPKWLFTISMRTSDGSAVTARMRISLRILLPNEAPYEDAIVINTKDPHLNIPGRVTFTNLDLGRTIPVDRAEIRSDARRRLEETALPTGMIPAGTYEFLVEVTPMAGGPGATTRFTIVISNPSSVELLSPFPEDPFVNPHPLFQWLYDGGSSRLSVFERLPGQGSLEETASGVPHLRVTIGQKSYQYPNAGVRSLQPGKSYVWYVEGLSGATGGTQTPVRSELRSFTVTSGNVSDSWLLLELERLLGNRYPGLIDQIKKGGLLPSGRVTLNGSPLSIAELIQLLGELGVDTEAITSATLE